MRGGDREMSIENTIDESENIAEETVETTVDPLEQIRGHATNEQFEAFRATTKAAGEVVKEPTAVEKEALDQGWTNDKEAFEKKTGKVWVPAAEFNSRKSFFVKIDSLKKKNVEQEDKLLKMVAYLQEVEDRSYKKALATLQSEYEAAIKTGKVEQVTAVQAKMEDTQRERDIAIQKLGGTDTVAPVTPSAGVLAFQERNKTWFNKDPENSALVQESLQYEDYWKLKRPELDEKQLLTLVEGDMNILNYLEPDKMNLQQLPHRV